MATNMNFNNFGNDPRADNGEFGRPPENFPLSRKPSIYSFTFNQLMNSGCIGKEVGSMNMDALLKNVWIEEELQNVVEADAREEGAGTGGVGSGSNTGMVLDGNLQRQGSLTLSRTLSQKTVDEVWKDMSKGYSLGKNGHLANGDIGSNFQTRQQDFGEITLEEFLLRAGIIREDTQLATKPQSGVFGEFSHQAQGNSNAGLGFGIQQLGNTTGLTGTVAFPMSKDQRNVELSANMQHQQLHQSQAQTPRPYQQIFPKQPAMPFATQMASPTSVQWSNPGTRNEIVGIGDQGFSAGLVQGSALQGGGMASDRMVGWRPVPVTVATDSPANQLSSDGTVKNNGNSSLSPVPCMFNGGLRGRRGNGDVEKVGERRQRRMIKNRESAARSRARKHAYTTELEAKVDKLKEENLELRRNQGTKMTNMQRGGKKRCLRRTQTGPW